MYIVCAQRVKPIYLYIDRQTQYMVEITKCLIHSSVYLDNQLRCVLDISLEDFHVNISMEAIFFIENLNMSDFINKKLS